MNDHKTDEVNIYLNEIAERLWSDNAAVMVGSGFSRNAKSVSPTTTSFPDWNNLGDTLYRKLHGKLPGKDARYLSLLKLADQIQAAFGRSTLNEILIQSIPDLLYEPSELHIDLLNLPWADVFTTNYDTLLERARAFVAFRRYDIVATDEDLLHANGPRIVKLHGSFPSPPYVITEEDYRRYPSVHAPFVNTVRQSLLEKTLCLIGFSGDDPNFLQWIGWLRDQIGEETPPKIFLLGVYDSLSEAERRLFDRRGIVPVDLSKFSEEPAIALASCLTHFRDRRPNALEWPKQLSNTYQKVDPDALDDVYEVLTEWRRQRNLYPGWVVMPSENRQYLWRRTKGYLDFVSKMSSEDWNGINPPVDLEIAFELTWRLDLCLFPITTDYSRFLVFVEQRYSNDEFLMSVNAEMWDTLNVVENVTSIRLWLLRYYREDGLDGEWTRVHDTLITNFDKLLPEQKAKLRLEEIQQELFHFNPAEAKRLLSVWQINDSQPLWEAKRAGLMAELGDESASYAILESSLARIRSKQNVNPIPDDYTLQSQESVVMQILWAVTQGISFEKNTSVSTDLLTDLSDRGNELKGFKCDPQREIEYLSASMSYPYHSRRNVSTSHGFDLGAVSNTLHFGPDEEVIDGYAFLQMIQDVGIPYRVKNVTFYGEALKSTIPRIGPFSPHLALVNITRIGDEKAIDRLFDREYLARLSSETVDRYLRVYSSALDRTITGLEQQDWSSAKTFESLAKTLPEILSRLVHKCSRSYRQQLVDALSRIYASDRRRLFSKVGRFARRLFSSMSVTERVQMVSTLVDFPVAAQRDAIDAMESPNPFLLLELPSTIRGNDLNIQEAKVDRIINLLESETPDRNWYVTSLVWLQARDKLNVRQSERFEKLMWKNDLDTLPDLPGFYSFMNLKLWSNVHVDLEKRVKANLISMIDETKKDSRFNNVLLELLNSKGRLNWTQDEAQELLMKFIEWWGNNRSNLVLSDSVELHLVDTRKTIGLLVDALSSVFSGLKERREQVLTSSALQDFVAQLESHGIPVKRLEASIVEVSSDQFMELADKVVKALAHNDQNFVIDALSASMSFAGLCEKVEIQSNFVSVGRALAHGVEWRYTPALSQRLRFVAALVRHHSWFLVTDIEESLLFGLEQLALETSSGVIRNDEDGVLSLRSSAAEMAFELSNWYMRQDEEERAAVRTWREICDDPQEFSEVRTAWLENTA